MKGLKFLPLLLACLLFFNSCQKEFSSEAGNAHGSLKADATGDCFPAMMGGIYKKDSLLKTTNYADIQVNITQTGTYFIKTDTVNGYFFSASGIVSATGINTIRLLASGKPILQSIDVFTVKFDTTKCDFIVTVMGSSGVPTGTTAIYTLGGSPGSCTGATLSGTYTEGAPANGSTVTVNVNVTQIGSYALSTGTAINGVSFNGSGIFMSTGANTITLIASGTAAGAGTFSYPISAGASNCNFSVTYTVATPQQGQYLFAKINGLGKTFNNGYSGFYSYSNPTSKLQMVGQVNISNPEKLFFSLFYDGTVIPVGTYNVSSTNYSLLVTYTDINGVSYSAQSGNVNPTPDFTFTLNTPITVTSVTASGTFTGAVRDGSGNVIQITNGAFSVNL